MYLIDTNVVSELAKRRRHPGVARWLAGLAPDAGYLSVISIGEIAKGIAKLRRSGAPDAAARADTLESWLDGLLAQFAERILPVDVAIATRWGRLCDAHPQMPADMLLAATALDHGLIIATRNTAHFERAGVPTLDPFKQPH